METELLKRLEPAMRRIASEEVKKFISENGIFSSAGNFKTASGTNEGIFTTEEYQKRYRLKFENEMALPLYSGCRVMSVSGPLVLSLVDADSGSIVCEGPVSNIPLEILVIDAKYTPGCSSTFFESFEASIIHERTGRRPLLHGELSPKLQDGKCSLGDFHFTDNSSWVQSRQFRLAVRPCPLSLQALKTTHSGSTAFTVEEAVTPPFSVKDNRGEMYKKHFPLSLSDEVWRVRGIGRGGSFCVRLKQSGITSVHQLLCHTQINPNALKKILGSGMSSRTWETLMKHLESTELSGRVLLFSPSQDQADCMGYKHALLFNCILQPVGLLQPKPACPEPSQLVFLPVDGFAEEEKHLCSVLAQHAYATWHQAGIPASSDFLSPLQLSSLLPDLAPSTLPLTIPHTLTVRSLQPCLHPTFHRISFPAPLWKGQEQAQGHAQPSAPPAGQCLATGTAPVLDLERSASSSLSASLLDCQGHLSVWDSQNELAVAAAVDSMPAKKQRVMPAAVLPPLEIPSTQASFKQLQHPLAVPADWAPAGSNSRLNGLYPWEPLIFSPAVLSPSFSALFSPLAWRSLPCFPPPSTMNGLENLPGTDSRQGQGAMSAEDPKPSRGSEQGVSDSGTGAGAVGGEPSEQCGQ